MHAIAKTTLILGLGAFTLTACDVSPTDPNRRTKESAATGALLGAAVGLVTGNDRGDVITGAILGTGAGMIIGAELDRQEAALRASLPENGIEIVNTGDRLIVTMQQDILFATNSTALRPDLRSGLTRMAAHLREYDASDVLVIGHTDNTGDAAYNQSLSERRALAVSEALMDTGVHPDRLRTSGRGERQPIASNLTAEGRAQNRRVEIVILPRG